MMSRLRSFRILLVWLSFCWSSAEAQTTDDHEVLLPRDRGYITITFDDATHSQFQRAFPILRNAGMPATLYVNTSLIDSGDPRYMSWDQVRTLAESGWEIGSHTVTHTALPTLSDVAVVGELVLARDRLEDEVGERPQSFASPFGEYDDRTLAYIRRYYASHLRAWGNNDGVNREWSDPYLIERINVDARLTAREVCSKVSAVKSGEWLVLMFHQVGEPAGEFISSEFQLRAIVRCIQTAVADGHLIVDTVSAVLAR